MRVIGYIRVSTGDQALSIEAQKKRLEMEANLRGWSLRILVDEGVSGARTPMQRPALSSAMRMLSTGEAQGIAVTKLDRMARSLSDIARLLELSREEGWGLIALDLGVDTSTAEGQLIVGILGSIAQWERARIQERIIEALEIAKQKGVRLGAPARYSDETAAYVMQQRSEGVTWEEIAHTLEQQGIVTKAGKRLSHSQLRTLAIRAAG